MLPVPRAFPSHLPAPSAPQRAQPRDALHAKSPSPIACCFWLCSGVCCSSGCRTGDALEINMEHHG